MQPSPCDFDYFTICSHISINILISAFFDLAARGNTTVCGEFNFTADPEAAYIVLNEYQCLTYLACWEFTCHSKLSWVWPPLH